MTPSEIRIARTASSWSLGPTATIPTHRPFYKEIVARRDPKRFHVTMICGRDPDARIASADPFCFLGAATATRSQLPVL